MNSLTVRNSAKINLALDVTGKLPNGYHTIESVFQTVGIYDETTITLKESGIDLTVKNTLSSSDEIPCNEKNIAFKAAKLFFNETKINGGCYIHLVKNIPSQAGMGGGSSDAAAVLYILNKLTDSKLSVAELSEIGKKIGADVPFFFIGGTAYVSGIGEKILPIKSYSDKLLVIAKGSDGVSTAEAYKSIDNLSQPKHPMTEQLVNTLNSNCNNPHIYFGNIFEEAVQLQDIAKIKDVMKKNNAVTSLMTGSGSAVFGLFNDIDDAEKCSRLLSENKFYSQICKTVENSFV